MSTGQDALGASVLDVAEVDRLGARLEDRERLRSMEHAEQLVDLLALHRVYDAAGMGLATPAFVALLVSCSEHRATSLLTDARVLARLGALEPMRRGLLTVEQSRAVLDLLGPLEPTLGCSLWQRLVDRLRADQQQGVVRPPARLRELLRGWVIVADPGGYADRRRSAVEQDADVALWRRDDGLVDLVGRALSAADGQACLDRIDQLAQPTGPDDTRSQGQRRRQVLVDLLAGRLMPVLDGAEHADTTSGCCPPGSAAPCGSNVFIHVPLPTAADPRSTPATPAELVGHGPLDHDAFADLLAADPVLHRVWVNEHGVPVAVDVPTWRPGRDDVPRLRELLAEIATGDPPSVLHPVHPDDHANTGPPSAHAPASTPLRVLSRPHLAQPGAYQPTRSQRRLLRIRAPRCEWPGCGRRASRAVAADCDLDHDLAWPYGATCACQMGPLCRRHHRIKQLGWHKRRNPDGSVRWTSPNRQTWTSPCQHTRPSTATRPRE